jgi:hypothetical protein
LTVDLIRVHNDDPGAAIVHIDGAIPNLSVVLHSEVDVCNIHFQLSLINVDGRLLFSSLTAPTPVLAMLGVVSCKNQTDQQQKRQL